jgi:hypothetical protein
MEQFLIHYTKSDFQADVRKIVAETIREYYPESKEPVRPKYGTRRQVKEEAHLSYPTLNRYDKEGILKAHKIGGRVLYLWSEVEKAINPDQPVKYRRATHAR